MKDKTKKIIKVIFAIVVLYCLASVGVFFAIKYGITNTYGKVDENNEIFSKSNDEFEANSKAEVSQEVLPEKIINKIANQNFCQIETIYTKYPENARKIIEEYDKDKCDPLISKMILAVSLRLKDDALFQNKMADCEKNNEKDFDITNVRNELLSNNENNNVFAWINLPEWKIIREAVVKDKDRIAKASSEANIPPRLLVASMIVEQLRLFNSQRELFKKFFEPLKILGNSTKISWGVIGMKEATAIKVEANLKDASSPYYLGKSYENKLDFTTDDPTEERFLRIANEKDHYYAYLYGALYLAEMMKQWRTAGYEIMYRPEIVGTLFNVGFPQSKPNPNPKVGGSEINVGEGKYSFGSLAYEFYYSGELAEEFPLYIK